MAEFESAWMDWKPGDHADQGNSVSNDSALVGRFQQREAVENEVVDDGPKASQQVVVVEETPSRVPNPGSRKRASRALTKLTEIPPSDTPAGALDRAWRAAWTRSSVAFAAHGTNPTPGTHEAATWLELLLSEGWEARWHWNEAHARTALKAIHEGRWTARIGDGRVLLSTRNNVHVARNDAA